MAGEQLRNQRAADPIATKRAEGETATQGIGGGVEGATLTCEHVRATRPRKATFNVPAALPTHGAPGFSRGNAPRAFTRSTES